MARRVDGPLRLALAAAAGVVLACGGEPDVRTDGAGASTSAAGTASMTSPPAAWTVTGAGWGPIRVGMSVADARAALGGRLAEPENRECDHVRPPPGPSGIRLMVVRGRVVRVEVSDTTVSTAAGARVGDTEARVSALYAGRAQTTPHKYVDGHYLIVRPGGGADSLHALVFETDGRRVTRFRGGRFPEVTWVEGCG